MNFAVSPWERLFSKGHLKKGRRSKAHRPERISRPVGFSLMNAFELQNDFSVAILGLSKFFREDAAMTAQTMQIGNRPCRIYGEAHAEYLLLQMTGEHELQSMESEVTAIAQSAHHFLFAAIPVESWNDALSPWKSPAVWGKQGFGISQQAFCNAKWSLYIRRHCLLRL